MNILAIGNSFSQDATRYLHDIARADGVNLQVVNLYIGGCSLERHHRNLLSGERAYELQVNGHDTGFFVSLKEALLNRPWDVVTLQQASHFSFIPDTYTPYARVLADEIRRCAPKARLIVHQTWAYEDGSERLSRMGYARASDMLADVVSAYAKAAAEIGAYGTIPSGELLGSLLLHGIPKVHRDTFHAGLGLGRAALGMLWYRMLTGNSVNRNSFHDFDEPVSDAELAIVRQCVDSFRPVL